MWKIPFNNIVKTDRKIKDRILRRILQNMESGDFILGKAVKKFEYKFAEYIGKKYCVGVNSGTSALEIGIKALNMTKGNIITHSNSYISTALGIIKNEHAVNFVDIDRNSLMIDVNKIEQNITDETVAICVANLNGNAANIDKIIEITAKYNLNLIEDCAQSHGAEYNGQMVGSFGDISCFSFYPTKNLGCYGDGGAICTNNKEVYERMLKLRNLGSHDNINFDMIGDNTKLDSIQACVLLEKIKELDYNNNLRHEKAMMYYNGLKETNIIKLPQITNGVKSVWHLFVVRVLHNNRDNLYNYLISKGIECKIHYAKPIHKQSIFKTDFKLYLPYTEQICDEIISLPFHPYIDDTEIKYIVDIIKSYQPDTKY